MNQDDVIRIALEAGILRAGDGWTEPHRWGQTEIERFAALVAAHEREECANVCEETTAAWTEHVYNKACVDCAAAIRARGMTMNEQTKAQRLAAKIDPYGEDEAEAAAELRRLDIECHTWEERSHMWVNENVRAAEEIKRLAALNTELVEALQFVVRGVPDTWEGVQKAREVIAKAKEQT